MKIRILAGGVEISINGVDYTRRQIKDLLGEVAGVALALEEVAPMQLEPAKPAFGFNLGVETELAEIVEPDLSEYFEEDDK
jgi:hypothetical protein